MFFLDKFERNTRIVPRLRELGSIMSAIDPSTYYTDVRDIFRLCHLKELRKWLNGQTKHVPTPELIGLPLTKITSIWIHLLDEIPIQQKGCKSRSAAPFAMFKAVLTHPWCNSHIKELLAYCQCCHREDGEYFVTLCSMLARIPQGSRLIRQSLTKVGPKFVRDRWVARHPGYSTVPKSFIYNDLLTKALKSSTIDDIKRLQFIGEWVSSIPDFSHEETLPTLATFKHNPLHTSGWPIKWYTACDNPRDKVFEYAFSYVSGYKGTYEGRNLPCNWYCVQSRRRIQTLLQHDRTAADHLLKFINWGKTSLSMVVPECLDVRKDSFGGINAYLMAEYPTLHIARDMMNIMLAANWVQQILSATPKMVVENWLSSNSCHCLSPECTHYSTGLQALLESPSFTGLDVKKQQSVVEVLAACMMGEIPSFRRKFSLRKIVETHHPRCLYKFLDRYQGDFCRVFHLRTLIPHYAHSLESVITHHLYGIHTIEHFVAVYGDRGVTAALAMFRNSIKSTYHKSANHLGVERLIKLHGMLMHYKLRNLRIRHKNQQFFRKGWRKNMQHTLNTVECMPPNAAVRPAGGTDYRVALHEFCEGFGSEFPDPPVHATPELLAWYAARSVVYSPKADGVRYRGSPDVLEYPPITRPIEINAIQAEEIEVKTNQGVRTLYMVFDVSGPELYEYSITERMELMRSTHSHCPSKSNLAADNSALLQFLQCIPKTGLDNNLLWWPKWCGKKQLATENFLRLVDEPPITPYPNDGWVLTPDVGFAERISSNVLPPDVKVKPLHEMTADLVPQTKSSHMVWRCVWKNGAWVPREERPEKRKPNPPHMVKWLEEFHQHPWRSRDLIPFMNTGHYHPTAQYALSAATRAFRRDQRKAQQYHLTERCAGKNVLDVGSGRGLVLRIATADDSKPDTWTGIDIDPVCVAQSQATEEKHTWLWGSADTMTHPMTGVRHPELAESSFDVILLINSIHHAANKLEKWVKNLTGLIAPGGTIVIETIDPVRLPAGTLNLPDGSFVRQISKTEFRISLAWAKSRTTPVTEQYFELDTLVSAFRAASWQLTMVCRADGGSLEAEKWAQWAGAHMWVAFKAPA